MLHKRSLNHVLESILFAQEKEDIVNNQVLTAEGRFPCKSAGCNKSFKYMMAKEGGTMS